MRIAVSAFLLLLLALTALAGNGCKRPQAGAQVPQASFARMAHLVKVHPLLSEHKAQATEPTFVFCHPRADQLDDVSISAAAAQVAFDLQANNDDRTEMIAADFERPEIPALPQVLAGTGHHASASAWPSVLRRPPRPAPGFLQA